MFYVRTVHMYSTVHKEPKLRQRIGCLSAAIKGYTVSEYSALPAFIIVYLRLIYLYLSFWSVSVVFDIAVES